MDAKQRSAVFLELARSGPWMAWFENKEFTEDWTTPHFPRWIRSFSSRRQHPLNILEIGSFEGRSAIFWLRFFPNCRLTCADPFVATAMHDGEATERRFDANLSEFDGRFTKIKGASARVLVELAEAGQHYDLIYIDGSHRRDDVMIDALLAWKILRDGGLMVFDDYEHELQLPRADRPKDAIDCFLQFHESDIRLISRGYQIIVERTNSQS